MTATLKPKSWLENLPQPEPMPDKISYDREREYCLAGDARRKENYHRYLSARRRHAEVDYLPVKLDIEPVSRCNFRCTMCQVSEWPKGKRADDMSFENFARLLDEQYGLVEIKLQGMGEALMAAEPFFEMIRYARQRHIWVRVATNASLLHLKENYRHLIDTGVNEVQISIDGATEEIFTSIRRGAVFDRVVSNCQLINQYCIDRGLSRTKMWVVVQEKNCHQLIELLHLAHKMRFTSLVYSLNLSDFGQTLWHQRNELANAEYRMNEHIANELLELGQKLGIKVAFWCVSSKYMIDSPDKLCPWPFERAYLSSDLRTVPCCMIANPDVFEISPHQGFSQAWKSTDYMNFRYAHLTGNIPPVCQSCYASQ